MLGIRQEEIDAPGEEFRNEIIYKGKAYPVGRLCEVVHAKTAEILTVYEKEYYKGSPAITRNYFGKGNAYYLAAEFGQEFLNLFYKERILEKELANPLASELPYGVTVSVREGEENLVFLQNFNDAEAVIHDVEAWVDADTGEQIEGEIKLSPFECRILVEK